VVVHINMLVEIQVLVEEVVLVPPDKMELFRDHHQENQVMVVLDCSSQHLLDHLLEFLLLHL
jgi:hypothetical protein